MVHVEHDRPVDRLRLVGPFKDDIPGINRCQFFGSFNTSKQSLQLDLKHPDGQAVAHQLLAWCDIALDSFTAGTMNELGLGYEVARQLNPSIIMATTCLMGQTGPAAELAGYGYHAAGISGFYEVTGWDDRPPAGPFNAYTDTIAPRFLATTLLAALDHRRRTGEGQFIDQAQMESALHFLGPELLDAQVSGRLRAAQRQRRPRPLPARRVPVRRRRRVVRDRRRDRRAVGRAAAGARRAVLGDGSGARHAGRAAGQRRADRRRARRVHVRHEPRELMELLQAGGVPAGMVQRSSDHQVDPQLEHRAFFRRMEHPEMGEVPYEGHQFVIAGYDNGPRFPAPCLGEHTYEVLSQVLGLDDDEVGRILASGACG